MKITAKIMAWVVGVYLALYGGMWVIGKFLDSLRR